jgi:hypothetical protein
MSEQVRWRHGRSFDEGRLRRLCESLSIEAPPAIRCISGSLPLEISDADSSPRECRRLDLDLRLERWVAGTTEADVASEGANGDGELPVLS